MHRKEEEGKKDEIFKQLVFELKKLKIFIEKKKKKKKKKGKKKMRFLNYYFLN